uniref:HECT-type E3 ubiquitin transferase n=1 Tax=Syphacia muris TaxID=451379 RepID=A0A0N5AZI7_9BILA
MEDACGGDKVSHLEPSHEMKIAINRYYKQLLEGCGRRSCDNEDCASSGRFAKLSSNEAAARAIQCLRKKAYFCDPLEELSERRVAEMLETCREKNQWAPMRKYLENTLSNRDVLLSSFVENGFEHMSSKSFEETAPDTPSSKLVFVDFPLHAPRKRKVLERDGTGEINCASSLSHSTCDTSARTSDLDDVNVDNTTSTEKTSVNINDGVSSNSNHKHKEEEELEPDDKNMSSVDCGNTVEPMDTSNINGASNRINDDEGNSHYASAEKGLIEGFKSFEAHQDPKVNCKSGECENPVICELKNGRCPTDMVSARRCFALLFKDSTDYDNYLQDAISAIAQLCCNIDFQLQHKKAWDKDPLGIVHIMNLIFELPFVGWIEFIEVGFTALCKMCANLGHAGQTVLASVWASFDAEWIQDKVNIIQQALTLRVLNVIDTVGSLPRITDRCEPLPTAVQTLSILYKTVLIKSKRMMQEETLSIAEVVTDLFNSPTEGNNQGPLDGERQSASNETSSSLSEVLRSHVPRSEEEDDDEEDNMNQMDFIDAWTVSSNCLCIPLSEFHNDTLSENFSVEQDFVAYMSHQNTHLFSVVPQYSFILSTEVKQRFLILHNRVRQRKERRHAIEQAIIYGTALQPYLRLTVRRDHVVRDALDGLAAIALDDVSNFKKQLKVYFDGEHAVDEGGVSKEFYQLVTQELFCPDYGMFVCNQSSGLYWFNSQCTFCDDEYNLIGLLFGLAIYNNVLVDVRFPTLLYTKLLARPGAFEDLVQLEKDLYNGLVELLKYEGDVEAVFGCTFQISYVDAYGNTHLEPLVLNGDKIPVTNENRREYVTLYADFLLNKLVKRQFEAFKAGFEKAANCELLRRVCLPHEVEELVCGVLDLDFDLLSQSVKYQNGYSEKSKTIEDFWFVAKNMSTEEKKMLLQFITGSDRVPVGGLLKLELIIARNGDDKLRLPAAHTCYNILLLPDYNDLDVMRERLMKAISYSRGFGLQ